jgi:hypothetical protein
MVPEAALELPFNKAYFSSSARVALEQHLIQRRSNVQELVFSGLGRYNPLDYVSFVLQDDLIISERLESAEKLTDMNRKRDYRDNRFFSSFKYDLRGNSWVSLEYTNAIRDYRSTGEDDWISHVGQLQIGFSFGHKTSTQVGFGLIRKAYEAGVYYTSIPSTVSLKRKLSSKLDAGFLLGSESRRYNESRQDRDLGKPILGLDIAGRFTRKIDSTLSLWRRIYDSDFAAGYAFVSKGADVSLVLSLSDTAQLILQGLYSRNGYIEIERTDEVFGGRGAIQYGLSRWGLVVLAYGYEQRVSIFPDSYYKQHKVDLNYVAIF